MYVIDIDNTIAQQPFDNLQIEQLVKSPSLEILSISLAKGATFPKHSSPKDAHLVVLEGSIDFHIENQIVTLTAQQHFGFSKEVEHWVKATADAKFLVIR
ncbi:cupin domain-containing protein [Flagellimonas pelagia]|uniref:Cupin domain-containing protein n=1 Tax=Flagellimonas pelagia TaxID=2306998 RepID=A0A3A1NL37_9FLAO|nr:cupin domain-containing protein [Allomuricauda maritima]RIV44274.1 cupin domain-containing protein [Allomuricauda maritima]TXJ94190.1 cupin domain-containing protein [Allomuricauda maritima]